MKQVDLNAYPEMLKSGQMGKTQVLHELVFFVERNGRIFGFTNKDEDLKSEVILSMLERGTEILDRYNPEYGSFFTFIFCYIKSLANTCIKKSRRSDLLDFHNFNEFVTAYDSDADAYNPLKFLENNSGKIPFSYKKTTPEALELACSNPEYKLQPAKIYKTKKMNEIIEKFQGLKPKVAIKTIMVLALKSAYYITDSQIETICSLCSVNKEQLQKTIQNLKEELMERKINKEKVEMRRNNAYYQHRKYKSQLLWINTDNNCESSLVRERLLKKYISQTKRWIKLNEKLEKGHINVRPTNKAIAHALGICERQVSYYIKYAEKLELI